MSAIGLNEENLALGIELGSTRIKAVLIGRNHAPVASGSFDWENKLENGLWTYDIADAVRGIQAAYRALKEDVRARYGVTLTHLGALGISGMMHGYLPFDREGRQLAAFRTWRNTNTARAAEELTARFSFNIPQRWSVAHLYQAILNGEEHVSHVASLNTLAGYIHQRLSGCTVIGVGEASGMFPIDSVTCDYDAGMLRAFDEELRARSLPYSLGELLPRVLRAGDDAGCLSPEGARLLDPAGDLKPGVPMCPPEGDAGTGMTATHSVAPGTGNVSAGTSVFAMVVTGSPLSRVYPEIDMVTTPDGAPVAMVHCNTCTSDINAWVELLGEMCAAAGKPMDQGALFGMLFQKALEGEPDCGGLVNFNCYTGEPVAALDYGCPMLVRGANARFTLANLMRAQILSSMAALRVGMDILLKREGVRLERLYGHGGLFKTPVVGQKLMAGALEVPVEVMETAGEGGPWGMAVLAAYRVWRAPGETLQDYLRLHVFSESQSVRALPDAADVAGFTVFMNRWNACLPAERAAGEAMRS